MRFSPWISMARCTPARGDAPAVQARVFTDEIHSALLPSPEGLRVKF